MDIDVDAGSGKPPNAGGRPGRYLNRAMPRGSNWELYTWLFMRVSGVLLLVLALGHLAIMHVINDVAAVNFAFVAARWSTPFWRTYDELLLLLALLHGGNGMRVIVDDYVRSPGWRLVVMVGLWVVVGFLLVLGSLVLLTFQPPAA